MVEQADATLTAMPPVRDEALRWFGSDKPAVLAVGDSHRAALVHAIHERRDGGIGAVLMRADALPDERYWTEVARADPELPIAVSFRGNSFNVAFLFQGPRPFTVMHPLERPGPNHELLPLEAVRDRLDTMAGDRASDSLHRILDRLDGHRCVLLAPPPPKREALIRLGVEREPGLLGLMRHHGWEIETAPITRLSLRLATRAIMLESFARIANEHGVGVLDSPSQAADPDGALRPEYAAPDATHANGRYGGLVWAQLAQHFQLSGRA